MSQRKPGRTRAKLAALLAAHFQTTVAPADIWDNYNPNAVMLDAARWGATFPHPENPRWSIQVHSWDTMGECVRRGFQSAADREMPNFYEIHVNEPAAAPAPESPA